MIDQHKTLGEIVVEYPDTVKVFNRYKIDYCCNGHESLGLAMERLETADEELIEALRQAMVQQDVTKVKDWQKASMSELIDYILTSHHVYMKETLEELNHDVFKILKVHFAGHGDQLLKVHHLFGTLKTELEAHLIKEEEQLFPLIKAYEVTGDSKTKAEILAFIQSTEDEHDAAGSLFKEIEMVTNDFKAPADACATYRRTFNLLGALQKDTFNHIHLENSVLFKKLDFEKMVQ